MLILTLDITYLIFNVNILSLHRIVLRIRIKLAIFILEKYKKNTLKVLENVREMLGKYDQISSLKTNNRNEIEKKINLNK